MIKRIMTVYYKVFQNVNRMHQIYTDLPRIWIFDVDIAPQLAIIEIVEFH